MKKKEQSTEEKPQVKKPLTKKGDPMYAGTTVAGAMGPAGFGAYAYSSEGGGPVSYSKK